MTARWHNPPHWPGDRDHQPPDPVDSGDRYAAMGWPHGDQACPSCGSRPDGIPTYRPHQPAAISAEGRAAYINFADKPEGRPTT